MSNAVSLLNTLLDDESKRAAPYPCLQYVASTQIYIIVAKLSVSLEDIAIGVSSTRFFHILINAEVEGVMDSKIFARSLIDFVRKNSSVISAFSGEHGSSGQDEGDLIELLFLIATKIRLDPDILPAWFYPERDALSDEEPTPSKKAFVGVTRKNAFPLFYLLIEYVYHDGRAGDFSRTGLLYLTETASKSKNLEKWMIESDLATIMASGLGALYSRLPRRLPSLDELEHLPPIISLSDYILPPSAFGFSSFDFQHNLEAFLSYLLFWQDTLNHCSSAEVADTLSDHFEVLFLQQLLYPSLLESTDVEGGSTACVITYLYRILAALDHPALVQRTLQYLLAFSEESSKRPSHPRRAARMSLSRRKSLNQLAALAEAHENPSPELFNLRDLIVMGLKSKHPETVVATLKLLCIILQKHHDHVRTSLYIPEPFEDGIPLWKMPTLNNQLQRLFAYSSQIGKHPGLEEGYSNILADISRQLETHSCSPHVTEPEQVISTTGQQQMLAHNCALRREMAALLTTFFANPTMTNLALTETIISLACCKFISLHAWLLSMLPPGGSATAALDTICGTVEGLLDQVRNWRSATPDWDNLIGAQREKLAKEEAEAFNTKSLTEPPERLSLEATPRGRRVGRPFGSDVLGSLDISVSPSPAGRSEVGSPSPRSRPSHSIVPVVVQHAMPDPDLLQSRVLLPQRPLDTPPPHGQGILKPLLAVEREDVLSSGAVTPSDQGVDTPDPTASLSHILTNAIILQEFVLEMAALVQVRAGLFGEVDFD